MMIRWWWWYSLSMVVFGDMGVGGWCGGVCLYLGVLDE